VVAKFSFTLENPKLVLRQKLSQMVDPDQTELKKTIQMQSDNLYRSIAKGKKSKTNSDGVFDFWGNAIKMTKLVQAKNDQTLGLIQAVAGTAILMLLFSVVGLGM